MKAYQGAPRSAAAAADREPPPIAAASAAASAEMVSRPTVKEAHAVTNGSGSACRRRFVLMPFCATRPTPVLAASESAESVPRRLGGGGSGGGGGPGCGGGSDSVLPGGSGGSGAGGSGGS